MYMGVHGLSTLLPAFGVCSVVQQFDEGGMSRIFYYYRWYRYWHLLQYVFIFPPFLPSVMNSLLLEPCNLILLRGSDS